MAPHLAWFGFASILLASRATYAFKLEEGNRVILPFRYGWRFHYGPGEDEGCGNSNCQFEKVDLCVRVTIFFVSFLVFSPL